MDELTAQLRRAGAVCVLTGSGISAESGLPTFRGANGLWRNHRVQELASPQGFARDPRLVWAWYNERRAAHARAEPNAGHTAIAALEALYGDFTLATQNVDSLHYRAGSRNVLELHGSLRRAKCNGCAAVLDITNGLALEAIDHTCGGRFRPDIVWFGEALPREVWEAAAQAAQRADVMIVVGTSGMVNPAAALCSRYGRQAFIAEINPEETVLTPFANLAVRAAAAEFLPRLLAAVNG